MIFKFTEMLDGNNKNLEIKYFFQFESNGCDGNLGHHE